MLTWQQTEFLLKGVYLGLLVMIAWLMPTGVELGLIALFTVGGLALFLGYAGYQKVREGYRVQGRWFGFLVFLLLECPGMVYAGLLVGLSFGSMFTFNRREVAEGASAIPLEAVWPVLGGAILGFIFFGMRNVKQPMHRVWLSLALIAVLGGAAVAVFEYKKDLFTEDQADKRFYIGALLLGGIPGFYLLTFAGLVEETEIEIAAMCGSLGVGFWAILSALGAPIVGGLVVLLPVGLFFVYTTRYMPAIRVLKHALRGISYRQMGQTRLALISLGRALQFDPRNRLARQQLWDIHRDLNFEQLKNEPDVVPFLNFNFCVERVSQMLQARPTPEALSEVNKMLDLIGENKPAMAPIVAYWRAVALLHERRYDDAAQQLRNVLELPQYLTAERRAIHFAALVLATSAHPEMARRVGQPLLAKPGQLMDAIAAVEYQVTLTPQDPGALDMKRQLYADLTEREYWSMAQADTIPPHFGHEYAQELGLPLLTDLHKWRRGCEYLRIAAHGLPTQASNLYMHIAHTHDKHGDRAGLWANYLTAIQVAKKLGLENLQPADKEAVFANVKKVGELALKENQTDFALEAFKFLSLHESAGIEIYRTLADLFEKKKDIWMALHCTVHGLTYKAGDPDLLARQDRYYFSISPADLQARLESVRKWFDAEYCKSKATWILERHGNDPANFDWAAHLAELAIVAQPSSLAARFLKARVLRLRGEIAQMTEVLEVIRQNKPQKFANEDESKAWYMTHRFLGDVYLAEKPDQAVLCYTEFRASDDAGADTSYKMGRAYEALGDFRNAATYYEEVTAYEKHPLYYEARDALDRVKRAPATS